MRARRPSNPERYLRYKADPANRVKMRARYKCSAAIRAGKLIPLPCEKCGAEKTEAHHKDYSKPLAVLWLCKPCHAVEHRKSHCIHGHALTEDNIRISRFGYRECRRCQLDMNNRYRARRIQNGGLPLCRTE